MSLIFRIKQTSDSMEMMVLSILGPALSCDWGIGQWEKAMMTTVKLFSTYKNNNQIF